jgi:lipoate-protein ligase A
MLIDTDLSNLKEVLKVNRPNLISKGVASVPSPVTNLREFSYTIDHSSFCEAVIREFQMHHGVHLLKVNESNLHFTITCEKILN